MLFRSLNRQKGVDILVEAAAKCSEIPFTLAGSVDLSFIDTGNLPPNVRWLGVIDETEKARAFRSAEALVFTSRSYEGFPMVFLEAMQEKLPVIAPDLAGYPEIVRKGVNGWLFRPGSADDLADVIRAVRANPRQSALYGRNGFDILEREYSSRVWYSAYMNLLVRLVSG